MDSLNRRNFLKITLAAVVAAECAAEENLKAHFTSQLKDGYLEVSLKLENTSDQALDFMAEIGADTALKIQAWMGEVPLESQAERRKLMSRVLVRNQWTVIPAKSTQMMKRTYFTIPANARASDPLNLQVIVVTRSGQMILKPSSLYSKPAD
jgi:hypothetical protein